MSELPPFVDIHCHLAPGIDDGAKSWDECLMMAKMAAADGIRTVVITPHQLGNYSHNSGDIIRALAREVQAFLRQHRIPIKILPGGDVRIESGMIHGLRNGEVMTLGDHRKHVLLELPHELYLPLEPVLAQLKSSQMVGILSHPERNVGILSNPAVIGPLVDRGCLMQVTAGSLTGAFGGRVKHLAEQLVIQGLTHFISTDAHSIKARKPQLRKAFERVAALTNQEVAEKLFCHNPAAVAAGRPVEAGRITIKNSVWKSWFGLKRAA